jgi:AbrB family looped-hinge helix DNA binding protein
MLIKTIKVSDKGQIAIPTDIRENIGIHKGDQMIMIQDGDKIMLERTSAISHQIKDDFKDLLKLSSASAKKLWSTKADDIWDKV